jgi:flagellar hook protein FlgE
MIRSMYSAVTGLRGHQTMLDVIGNNIANVNTVGFKSSRVLFRDLYYQNLANPSAPTATSGGTNPRQIGYGSKIGSVDLITTRSGYQQTSKTLDMYISGEGYFAVQNAKGMTEYTRIGSFDFNSD